MDNGVDQQFADAERIERWPAGKTLFSEGEQPRGIYIVHKGEVDLVFSARNGTSKALRVARRGEVLGLSDVVAKAPHDCTATTRTAARIGFIAVEELVRLLDETPSLWLPIAQHLSTDLGSCWAGMRRVGAAR